MTNASRGSNMVTQYLKRRVQVHVTSVYQAPSTIDPDQIIDVKVVEGE